MNEYHTPVLLDEILDVFAPAGGKRIIDATLGGGGHATALRKAGAIILGIDADPEAIRQAGRELERVSEDGWTLVRGNFREILTVAKDNGFEQADGVLFDLGISSHQIDTKSRGFSYKKPDSPLDGRFNQTEGRTAGDIINSGSHEELYEIFSTFGEEKHARSIADALVSARAVEPILTAGSLTGQIDRCVGSGINTGTYARIFQALRISVNGELASLKKGLSDACGTLAQGGKIAVISYHSLEDRIVKLFMRSSPLVREITHKPVYPSDDELRINRRSRSAKLRVAQKI